MNIYDISNKAGVSIATVSRVLNNSDKVSEATRKKVLKIMEDTGYEPNVFARGLSINTIQTIGLLCADCSDNFLANALSFLEKDFRANNYDCILCCTGYENETIEKYIKLIQSKKVDAIVLVGSSFVKQTPEENKYILEAAKKVPVFCINGFFDAPNVYCTLCDDTQATSFATTKILDAGFKKPLFIYREKTYSGLNKLKGFEETLAKRNITAGNNQILLTNTNISDTAALLKEHYKKYQFDCVVASDDELAIAAHKFATNQNLRIPDDFSIIGYNNSKIAVCCEPEITSMDNQLEAVCKTTVDNVMKLFNNENFPKKTVVKAEYVERETTV